MKKAHSLSTELITAIKTGNLKLIDSIIEKANKGIKNIKNDILLLAVIHADMNVVKYLAEMQGVDIHENNEQAFRTAAEYNRLDVVKYFVEQGADIHACDDEAINFANIIGHYDMFIYLKSLK